MLVMVTWSRQQRCLEVLGDGDCVQDVVMREVMIRVVIIMVMVVSVGGDGR